jgi:hypothetical protein
MEQPLRKRRSEEELLKSYEYVPYSIVAPELVYTIVNPIASVPDLRNRYSPSGLSIRFPCCYSYTNPVA